MKTDKILVTGSSGSLGRRLVRRLLAEGYSVAGFDVNKYAASAVDSGRFQFYHGDVVSLGDLARALQNTSSAIHCAALLPQKQHLGRDAFIRVNAAGTVNFLEACVRAGVGKAVIISNTGVLRPVRGGVTDDAMPYRDSRSFYLESKILAEKGVDALALKDKINYCILRPAALYGPGMEYKWTALFELAARGRLYVVASGEAPYSVIHVDDLIDAVLLALDKLDRGMSGEKITICSNEKMTVYELLAPLAAYCGRRPPARIPFGLALMGAHLAQLFSKINKSELFSPITVDSIIDYRYGLWFDTVKAKRLLSFESRRHYQSEIQTVLREYFNGRQARR